jgi:hypothetical protein
MSSVDIRFRSSLYKCFIIEKIPSTYALLQGIENKKEMNLCRLGEGVGLTYKSIAHSRKH